MIHRQGAGQQSRGFPKEVSEFPIPDRPGKSRFRSLFSRKKVDRDGEGRLAFDNVPPVVFAAKYSAPKHHQNNVSPPAQATRSRSTTWSSRSFKTPERSVKHERPRALTSWDPPPLFQATTQAVLQDVLDVHSSFSDLVFGSAYISRNNAETTSSSIALLPSTQTDASELNVDIQQDPHKRNWSSSSSYSLTQKLFILVDRGYLLQYNAEGNPDRLPEKILELGPSSVAIASDALPGKHWVLRVSQDGKADQLQTQTPKTSWSRLPFRSMESKRLVKDFLLVFESAKAFDAWLTAVRREIEALGGLEYRPDSQGPDGDFQGRRQLQPLRAHKSFGEITHTSSNLSLTGPASTPFQRKNPPSSPPPPLPRKTHVPRKSAASSSVGTVTELDHLRGPSISDRNSSGTTTTSSFEGSAASSSPAADTFPVNLMSKPPVPQKSTASVAQKRFQLGGHNWSNPTTAQTSREDARKSSSVDPSLLWSFKFPRNPMVPNEKLHSLLANPPLDASGSEYSVSSSTSMNEAPRKLSPEPPMSSAPVTDRRSSEPDATKSRPVSVVAPLPEFGALKKAASRYRKDNIPNLGRALTSPVEQPPDSPATSGRLDSTTHEGPKRVPSYTLFPKRCSSLDYSQALSGISLPSPPPTCPAVLNSASSATTYFPFPTVSTPTDTPAETYRPPPVSHIARREGLLVKTNRQSLVTDDAARMLERSPAVTDAHLATVFGTQWAPRITPVEASDNRFESSIMTTTIELPAEPTESGFDTSVTKLALPPKNERRFSPHKSTPTLLYSAVPPLGPPPNGPLPAVPSLTSSTTSSPKTFKAAHGRGKSSLSSTASRSSLLLKNQPSHSRVRSSLSSIGSVNSALATAQYSPTKPKHTRKLSSVSSVGSMGSISGWVPPSTIYTLPPSPSNVPHLTLDFSPSPALSPVTPKFLSDSDVSRNRTKPRSATITQGQTYRTHMNQITIVSPGTAF